MMKYGQRSLAVSDVTRERWRHNLESGKVRSVREWSKPEIFDGHHGPFCFPTQPFYRPVTTMQGPLTSMRSLPQSLQTDTCQVKHNILVEVNKRPRKEIINSDSQQRSVHSNSQRCTDNRPIISISRLVCWYWQIVVYTSGKYGFLFLLPKVNKHENGFRFR